MAASSYYSVPRFLDEIANGDGCFICGAKPGTKNFNREHVIPDWVLRDRCLHSGNIALPNTGAVMYGRHAVPCCEERDNKMGQIFETPVSDAFARGAGGCKGADPKRRRTSSLALARTHFPQGAIKRRDLRSRLGGSRVQIERREAYKRLRQSGLMRQDLTSVRLAPMVYVAGVVGATIIDESRMRSIANACCLI